VVVVGVVESCLVSLLRIAVAEARGQFKNVKEWELPPLEAITRRMVKTQQAEKI
jgi:hypothetical protein